MGTIQGFDSNAAGIARLRVANPKMLDVLLPFGDFFELPDLDYLTLRDLLELGRMEADPPLIFMLMNMFAALEEGSLCLYLEKRSFLQRFPRNLQQNAGRLLEAFFTASTSGRYADLIGSGPDDYRPLIRLAAGGRDLLYFQKYLFHESRLKRALQGFFSSAAAASPPPETVARVMDEIYSPQQTIRVGAAASPMTRDAVQVKALEAAMGRNLTVISGGPGTGKTSLMVNLLRCLVRCGITTDHILLGAPTGRAAQRMTEALQTHLASIRHPSSADQALLSLEGGTLHRILRYDVSRHRFVFGPARRLSARAIVLDEVSMVDVVMMDHLLQAIDPLTTRLILLGDKDQLPSVEAGAVLADLIPAHAGGWPFKDRLVILKTAFRSGERLVRLAEEINSGHLGLESSVPFSEALAMGEDRWAFVRATDGRHWRQHLIAWAGRRYLSPLEPGQESYLKSAKRAGQFSGAGLAHDPGGRMILDRMFRIAEQARILCLTRRGDYGCNGINHFIVSVLSQEFGSIGERSGQTVPGELIMILRNDYALGLFNGDVGIALRDRQAVQWVFFRRSDGYIGFPLDVLPPWEPAFALTVHKSQGSEFEDVLLVLPEAPEHRLLTREMIYTAVTRAKKRVILYGRREALLGAVGKRIQRQTGMGWGIDGSHPASRTG